MAENRIDYDVLADGVRVYAQQASALEEVISALDTMNGQLESGWSNETSRAFIERYNSEHKPALEKARESIQNISDYIAKYSQNRQEEDSESAAGI